MATHYSYELPEVVGAGVAIFKELTAGEWDSYLELATAGMSGIQTTNVAMLASLVSVAGVPIPAGGGGAEATLWLARIAPKLKNFLMEAFNDIHNVSPTEAAPFKATRKVVIVEPSASV